MKVAFFNTNNIWGGGEQWHFNMLKGLKQIGKPVIGVASQSPLRKKLEKASISVFGFKASGVTYLNPWSLYKLYRFYKREKIKAVIFGIPHDLKAGGIAAKWAGVEKIIYARALAAPVKDSVFNRYLFKHVVTHVVANSEETMRQMLTKNETLIPKAKRHVIYYGMDVASFDQKSYEVFSFKEQGKYVIGNAGRLTAQKGQMYLLDLAEKLIEKGMTNFKIVIAGSGDLERKLKSEIDQRKIYEFVEILGFVSNVKSFMKSIDVFVLTSLWEGFGFVISEAFLCEKPVVAWDTTSNPELIQEGENGNLVKVGDIEAMSQRVMALLKDPDKSRAMGKAGYQHIASNFTKTQELEQWEKLLG